MPDLRSITMKRLWQEGRIKPKSPWNKGIKLDRTKYPNAGNIKKYAQVEYKCVFCGKYFKYFKSRIKRFCSRGCWSKWLIDNNPMNKSELRQKVSENRKGIISFQGEEHWNWQGGKSFEPYPLGWNKTFKEQIRFRDGYKCQICGCSEVENGKKLSVHHKDYNKSNIDIDNLISLCHKCHIKTNYRREFWLQKFKVEV